MEKHSTVAATSKRQAVRETYQHELLPLLRNPAAWCFGSIWLASLCCVVLLGQAELLIGALLFNLFLLALTLLTVFLTKGAPEEQIETTPGERLWLQLGVILLFVLLTGYYGMVFNGVQVPFLSHKQAQDLVTILRKYPYEITNFILYFVLPMVVLLLLRVRWREVGFGHGYSVWRIIGLWSCAPVIGIIVFTLTKGWGILANVGEYLVLTFFAAGFSEEFLFRGALLTRLRRLIGTSWGVVVSSLIFGLWHLGTNLAHNSGGDYLLALAFGIFSQALIGLCFAIIFLRTRNLVAPAIAHVLIDLLGAMFG